MIGSLKNQLLKTSVKKAATIKTKEPAPYQRACLSFIIIIMAKIGMAINDPIIGNHSIS